MSVYKLEYSMSYFVLVSASILICTFAIAIQAKLQDASSFKSSLSSFGFPTRTHTLIATMIPILEAVAVVALVFTPLRWAGSVCLLLFIAFTVVSTLAILQGRHPQCLCFGNFTQGNVGLPTILRNVALASLSAILLAEDRSLSGVISSSVPQTLVISGLIVAVLGLIAVLLTLLRRYGEVLHTLDRLGVDHIAQEPALGFTAGDRLPNLTLSDWNRHPVLIADEIRKKGIKAAVLVSSTCSHCDELLPILQSAADRGFEGAIIVKGTYPSTLDRYRDLHNSGWPILTSDEPTLTSTFRIAGFPALVPLDERGNVEGGTILGRQTIERFLGAQFAGSVPGM